MNFETAHIKKNASGQEINIPNKFKFSSDDVYLKKIGNAIMVIPTDDPWDNFKSGIASFTNDFMEDREQYGQQTRESFEE